MSLVGLACVLFPVGADAQLCTTQAKLSPALRDTLAQAALGLASAVKGADLAAVRAATIPSLAGNFAGTEGLVRAASGELSGETLQVTQLYLAAPPGLTEGLSADSPVVLKEPDGGEIRITQMYAEAADRDGPVRLVLHVAVPAGSDSAAMRARGTAASQALLAAHPELRPAFTGMLIFVEKTEGSPEVLSLPMGPAR